MRISDWSSDVCSSDLIGPYASQAADRDMQQKQIAAFLRAGHDFELARRFVGAGPGGTGGVEEEWDYRRPFPFPSAMLLIGLSDCCQMIRLHACYLCFPDLSSHRLQRRQTIQCQTDVYATQVSVYE